MSAGHAESHGHHGEGGGGGNFGKVLFGDVIGGGVSAMVHGILFPWTSFGGGGGGGHGGHDHGHH